MDTLSATRLDQLRRRTVVALVSGVALGSTGYIAAVTVATIVARDLTGSDALAGAPGATVVLGAAIGATLLSRLMVRRGRGGGQSRVRAGRRAAGYATLGLLGVAMVAVPAYLVPRRRRMVAAVVCPG